MKLSPKTPTLPSPGCGSLAGEGLGGGSLPQRLEDADEVGDGGAAHVEDAGELRVLDLHAAGGARELHRREDVHRDAGGADRVALGLEPARGIYRQLAVLLGPALENGPRPLALCGQPHRLVFDELGGGEAVMRLHQAEIAEAELGASEGALPGEGRTLESHDVALAHGE